MFVKKIIYSLLIVCLILFVLSWKSTSSNSSKPANKVRIASNSFFKEEIPSSAALMDEQVQSTFQTTGLDSVGLSYDVFRKAYIGFLNLKAIGKVASSSSILSIVDFNLSSKLKRLWIVDIEKGQVLLNTWVSHGRGSGGDMATEFSNTHNSHQSSIGFYVTGEVYSGKHGRSLRLDGMDAGYNSKARERAIVIHGAEYVSEQTIRSLNRLGLSHGCPAVPLEFSDQIIDLVKDKTVLFIHADVKSYQSKYLDEELAGKSLLASILDETASFGYENL